MNLNKLFVIASVLILCTLFNTRVYATPLQYSVDLTITEWYDSMSNPISPISGMTISALAFTVDSSLLSSDGLAKAGQPSHAFLQIGDTVWAQDFASDLDGFRGPCYNPYFTCTPSEADIWGLDSDYWGFDVQAGEISGLWGGMFGVGDIPFIDFLGTEFSSALFVDLPINDHDAQRNLIYVHGNWTINRLTPISEPMLISLLGFGILFLRRRNGSF